MDATHRRTFRVHTYDTDFRGRALPVSILNFLQEAAGEHVALLGLSVTDLMKDGLTWVLSRHHVHVSRHPAMGEALEIRTWPSGQEGFFWLRDFDVRDSDGRSVIRATSSWVLLNLQTKRPTRGAHRIPAELILDQRALQDEFPRLPGCDVPERDLRCRVGLYDLDLNDHVITPCTSAGRSRPRRRRRCGAASPSRSRCLTRLRPCSATRSTPGCGGPSRRAETSRRGSSCMACSMQQAVGS